MNAALRYLSLNEEGSVAERRYRLVRFQFRRQLHANLSWNEVDNAPVPGGSSTFNTATPRPNIGNFMPRTRNSRPSHPTSSHVSLSTNTQVTFSGVPRSHTPTTTTTTTVSSPGTWQYTTAPNVRQTGPRDFFNRGDLSMLREENFATGTPTQAGYEPPYSEPFSFMGHNSLINTTRAANSTVRGVAATTSAGGSPQEINSSFETPIISVNRGRMNGRIPSLPNVPQDDASLRDLQFLPSMPSTLAPRREMPHSRIDEPLPLRSSSATLHAGEIVRKWKLQFDGKRDHSAEEFLLRVNECRSGTRLTELDLLDTLPHLLSGLALQWYRLERPRWAGWREFLVAFRRRFGGVNFQLRVREEVRRRTQGPDEAITDYLVGLRHIMNYVSPPYSLEEQVDFAYANLHPNYRSKIERDQIRSLEELEAKGEQLEAARLLSREYRPPPSPRDSLFPEHAYNGQAGNKRASAAAAIGTNTENSSTFGPSASPNRNKNRRNGKSNNVSPRPPPIAHVVNTSGTLPNNTLPATPKSDGIASTSTEIQANSSSQPPSAADSVPDSQVKKNLKCYWCEAPDVTIRSCQNVSCVERRQFRGNRRRGRQYGSSSPPMNK